MVKCNVFAKIKPGGGKENGLLLIGTLRLFLCKIELDLRDRSLFMPQAGTEEKRLFR